MQILVEESDKKRGRGLRAYKPCITIASVLVLENNLVLKAVLNCPLTEAKFSYALLKLFFFFFFSFFNESGWKFHYWNENKSNDIFHYSVSLMELEFQPILGLSRMPFFHHFYPKIDVNAYFNCVFSNIGWFNRKTANAVRFPIIKIRISITFMHLRSKLTSEMCVKIGGLDGKRKRRRLKVSLCNLFFFFSKK